MKLSSQFVIITMVVVVVVWIIVNFVIVLEGQIELGSNKTGRISWY